MSGHLVTAHRSILVLVLPGLAALGAAAVAQQPIQWSVQSGGNGHWYQLDPQARSWPEASALAAARGGHLATIRSAAENAFVVALSTTPPPGINRTCWLGGYQVPGSCEPGCGWRWVTDEPFDFTLWGAGEPNNAGVNESCLHIWVTDRWNDARPSFLSESVIEWSADCNVDGIVDFGQIREGALPDTNGNGVPDGCECSSSPALPACCIGNLNGDAVVDGADLGILLGSWGNCSIPCAADFNRDAVVDGADLGVLLNGWGACAG